jgi:phospholipase/carboxylesterase
VGIPADDDGWVGRERQEFPAPVVATYGATSSTAPLVVLLHGRGSHERNIVTLAPHLPHGPAYAALRGPIPEDKGFAWFANRGVGRPVAESLADTMVWFRDWLGVVAPRRRRVYLIGFSGGAAFAGGLLLDRPSTIAGVAMIGGSLPFDAGLPESPGRLSGTRVFVSLGEQDTVIPPDLLARTWSYLVDESGAEVTTWRDPGGHEITPETQKQVSSWLAQVLVRRR